MIRGIIFDLDGVLIESEPLYIEAEIEIFNKHGIPLTKEVAYKYLGLKFEDYINIIARFFNKKVDIEEISKEYAERLKIMYEEGIIPLTPNSLEVLAELKKTYLLALATSQKKQLAKIVMEKKGLSEFFEHGVYKEDVKNGKPDPEVFLKAASLINVPPQNCVVVEDAINGMKAGKAAGMHVVARKADYNKNQDFSFADYVITDLKEIPSLLKINFLV